jgi:hypothetical protein
VIVSFKMNFPREKPLVMYILLRSLLLRQSD